MEVLLKQGVEQVLLPDGGQRHLDLRNRSSIYCLSIVYFDQLTKSSQFYQLSVAQDDFQSTRSSNNVTNNHIMAKPISHHHQ